MKIVELKIDVQTTEVRRYSHHDPDAVDADEDGYVTLEYKANLPQPTIRPLITLKNEPSDEDLIPGGIYLFAKTGSAVRFVAVDKETLKQTEYAHYDPKEFIMNIDSPPFLIAQAMREGK